MGGRPGTTSTIPITAPAPAQPTDAPSPSEVQEIPPEEVIRKAPEVSSKRLTKDLTGQRKKAKVPARHKSRREGEKSKSRADKGKEPTAQVEGTPTPRPKPKSVKELCNACPREDDQDYHIIRVSSQPEPAPDAPFEIDLTSLTHEMWIRQDDEASTRYA
ncbi:hypothetical protein B296_00026489 [Ensete ventricosum]|uniref:Uncharacterized protein n=1 Tax=Ensete ventricosum TaxID=4639 RepID=A0A426XUM0_ENSVE|nr:hypothetical protein B296_00026489 [Ensete ventricosum]